MRRLTHESHGTESDTAGTDQGPVSEEPEGKKLAETGEFPLPNTEEDGQHCECNECSDL